MISDPASIAWLLNIRGADVPFTPFALGFALAHAEGAASCSWTRRKLPPETREWLGNGVAVAGARCACRRAGRAGAASACGWIPPVPGLVRPDAARGGRDGGRRARPLPAAQGLQERNRARRCPRRSSARCRGDLPLSALARRGRAPAAPPPRCPPPTKLLAFRGELEGFRGESFPAISGAGEHGAIIHYRVTEDTNRPIRPNEVYLIDSRRAVPRRHHRHHPHRLDRAGAPPAELREQVTRVMKGHIAIATAVFPAGVGGVHLDAFARRALWQAGLDYDHGTGHGVGSYLSVHEGPVSLSRLAKPVPIAEGMILSNEPGFYLPGSLRHPAGEPAPGAQGRPAGATKPFLCFETLTLAPFDTRLIEPALLDADRARLAERLPRPRAGRDRPDAGAPPSAPGWPTPARRS